METALLIWWRAGGQSRAPHGSALPLVFHNTQDRSSRRVLPLLLQRTTAAAEQCSCCSHLFAAQPVLMARNNIDQHLIEIRRAFPFVSQHITVSDSCRFAVREQLALCVSAGEIGGRAKVGACRLPRSSTCYILP